MVKNCISFLIIIFVSLVIVFPLMSQDFVEPALNQTQTGYNERFHKVRNKVIKIINEGTLPSLSLAVAQDGEIVWEEAFGWADREKMMRATPRTMYSLASVSKPLTATGLMVLSEKDLINLNNPVNDYLGDAKLTAFEGNVSGATVKRILNHTAGLPSHVNFFFEDEPCTRPSMDETIRKYGILVTAPGEEYRYSNLGYGIIDYIISRMSRKSYAEFMKREVFIPLGMTHTSVKRESQRVARRLKAAASTGPRTTTTGWPNRTAVQTSRAEATYTAIFGLTRQASWPTRATCVFSRPVSGWMSSTASDCRSGFCGTSR